MNVYGLRNARATIHIDYFLDLLTEKLRLGNPQRFRGDLVYKRMRCDTVRIGFIFVNVKLCHA